MYLHNLQRNNISEKKKIRSQHEMQLKKYKFHQIYPQTK
jgi:hypothetical protein